MESIKNFIRLLRVLFCRTRALCTASLKGETPALIIAPHPDDEVMDCGGLIQRLCAQSTPPHVVILTGGGKSHSSCCDIDESSIKKARHLRGNEMYKSEWTQDDESVCSYKWESSSLCSKLKPIVLKIKKLIR